MNNIGKRKRVLKSLFEIVKEKGYSQKELASATDLKQANISRMKNGKYPPNLDNILKICDATKITLKFESDEQGTNS